MSTTDDPRGPGPVPPADELDELASALVDGEATAEETARAADADVAARVAAFERVADVLGAPVPAVDAATRDRAIAAAVATWGTEAADDTRAPDELAARRRRRPASLRPLGIAAAVVAAVALGGVALQGGRDDGDDTVASADSDTTTAAEAAPQAGGSSGAGVASDALAMVDFGSFDSFDELAAVAAGEAAARTSAVILDSDESSQDAGAPVPSSAGVVDGCPPPAGSTVVVDGRAELAGRPVVVHVIDDADGRRVVVYDAVDCAVLADEPPPG